MGVTWIYRKTWISRITFSTIGSQQKKQIMHFSV